MFGDLWWWGEMLSEGRNIYFALELNLEADFIFSLGVLLPCMPISLPNLLFYYRLIGIFQFQIFVELFLQLFPPFQ